MVSLLRRAARKLPTPVKDGIRRAAGTLNFLYNNAPVTAPDGQVFDVPPNMNPLDRHALKHGNYESDEIGVLRQFFKRETGTIIDIGANIGVVARYAIAERLGSGGLYVCVEPNPEVHKALAANMDRASAAYPGHDTYIEKVAIGSPQQNGKRVHFAVRPGLGSGLTTWLKPSAHEITVPVPVMSLSRLMAKHLSQSTSLICDAEGGEIPIIFHDRGSLKHVRQIVIELHEPQLTGWDVTPNEMIRQLSMLGFQRRGGADRTHYFSRDPA
jgi:FkbM family methyltransferase